MMSNKCTTCGLVNYAGIEACRRCGTPVPGAGQYGANQYGAGQYGAGQAPSWGADQSAGAWPPPGQSQPSDQYGGAWQQGTGTMYDGSATYGRPASPHAPTYGYYGYATATPALASLGARFGAALLDSASYAVPLILALVLGVSAGRGEGVGVLVLLGLLALVVVLIVQFVMLVTRGQTIGKRLLGIRIVKLDTHENGGFVTNIVMRGLVPGLIGAVPYIGVVFSLVNILFIFKEDRRCIHDLIAGTIVVTA
jgi:uncharacterized RDD family membrane protein YckC